MTNLDRLGHLTESQLQGALNRFDLGRLIHTEPITTGNFGQNLFIDATSGRYVFRGNPLRDYQFAKEQFFAQLLNDGGSSVAAPWPYHHEPNSGLFGWEYAIMPRLIGVQFADKANYEALSNDDRAGIASAMSLALADIQRIEYPVAGTFDLAEQTIAAPVAGYRAMIESWIVESLEKATHLDEDDRRWAAAVIAAAREPMATPFLPVFVHGDYSTQNVVADLNDGRWHITGLFDLMSCHIGDGEFDLARQFCACLERDFLLASTFLETYQTSVPPRAGRRERLALYILNERLSIWEWAKRTNMGWWPADLTMRAWIQGFIDAIPPSID